VIADLLTVVKAMLRTASLVACSASLCGTRAGVSAYGICQEKFQEIKGQSRHAGKCQVQIAQTGCLRTGGHEAHQGDNHLDAAEIRHDSRLSTSD
jgi:hypothetical protein